MNTIDVRSFYYLIDVTQEAVVSTLNGNAGWVSINSYDARCLNTRSLWISDVDFDDILSDIRKKPWKDYGQDNIRLLAQADFGEDMAVNIRDNLRQELVSVAVKNTLSNAQTGSYRVYETCGGLRVIRLDRPIEPRSQESVSNHLGVGTDNRYTELCIYQNCYRARLTPKPWRVDGENARVTRFIGDCEVFKPEHKTPWEEGEITWKRDCITPCQQLRETIGFHDHRTQAFSDLELIA